MKLITWNVNRSSVRRFRRQATALAAQNPDILALTEMGVKAGPRAEELLREHGFDHVVDSRHLLDDVPTRASGVLLASRFPLEAMVSQFDVPKNHRQRVLSATFQTPFGPLEGHVVHVPPGSSWGWQKIEVFEALSDRLATDCEHPRFLAGDFNSPAREHPDGGVDVFGSKKQGSRWSDGERSVLVGLADYGLADAFRAVHGYDREAWSHKCVRKGVVKWRRRFDHVFACPSLKPSAAKYLHELDEHSDHTPLELVFNPESAEQSKSQRMNREQSMTKLTYEEDVRSTNPNETGHRRGRFKAAWKKAVRGESYGSQALKRLTWDNLGWRLGRLFGATDDELIDEMYDWCVRQQEESP